MARSTSIFVCQSCGATSSKWAGRVRILRRLEHHHGGGRAAAHRRDRDQRVKGRKFALEDLKTEDKAPPRRVTGIAEFDRVTAGGIVPGSALLIGGDPGVGKSTLILQALAAFASRGGRAVYISARRRWRRCGCAPRAWGFRKSRRAGRGDQYRGHSRDHRDRAGARHRRHRFDPDDLDRRARGRARHHRTGAHRFVRSRPLRQSVGRRRAAGRACHQGRPDRRAEGGGASG